MVKEWIDGCVLSPFQGSFHRLLKHYDLRIYLIAYNQKQKSPLIKIFLQSILKFNLIDILYMLRNPIPEFWLPYRQLGLFNYIFEFVKR